MTCSLYDATIPSFKQSLHVVSGLLTKAEEFCTSKGFAPETILQARLADDMWPFAAQVFATVTNSWGHIEKALATGVSSPNPAPPPADFAGLKSCVTKALAGLDAVTPAQINALVGTNIRFVLRDHHVDFIGEDFFFSFALPNFYFHTATAYDILRWRGVPLAKRDYLGTMRMKH